MKLNEDIELYTQCRGECESCTRCVGGMCPIENDITTVKRKAEEIMRKKWTTAEETELARLVEQGWDNVRIAEHFGVTAAAVQGKKNKLRASGLLDKADRRGRPLNNIEKPSVKKEDNMAVYSNVKRGDIYYVKYNGDTVGSEQRSGRPAIIVGNDIGNEHSDNVEIVYLTTKDKPPMPTHVRIDSASQPSTALCESVSTISKERLGSFCGTITETEQRELDRALLVSFGLVLPECEKINPTAERVYDGRAEIERDIYKQLYTELVNRYMPKEKPAEIAD